MPLRDQVMFSTRGQNLFFSEKNGDDDDDNDNDDDDDDDDNNNCQDDFGSVIMLITFKPFRLVLAGMDNRHHHFGQRHHRHRHHRHRHRRHPHQHCKICALTRNFAKRLIIIPSESLFHLKTCRDFLYFLSESNLMNRLVLN